MTKSVNNRNLRNAKKTKQDEFYTQTKDIENEMRHYKNYFKNKIIYCNCDDPYESNFFKYFSSNFNKLGLKKLIATCYAHSLIADTQLSLFNNELEEEKTTSHAHKIEMTELKDYNNDGAIDYKDVEWLLENQKDAIIKLKEDGDFRSHECIELLKESDIVVTNPPFSLFREYVAQLITYNKKFIIIGNQNAITYKEFCPLLKDNKVWMGHNSGFLEFIIPDYYEKKETGYREEIEVHNNEEKVIKYRGFGNICWFTNVETKKRHEELILYKEYNAKDYPKYDNYNAINVNKVNDIPVDYKGAIGVPITFMNKYNPEQFEIISCNDVRINNKIPFKEHGLIKDKESAIKGRPTYVRIVIKHKKKE